MKKLKYILQIFIVVLSLHTLQSCREDSLEVAELDRTEVASYTDLFNTFWDTMNNDYNYFNEQEENWDNVYKKYSPKFKKLTTFNKADANPIDAEKEANLAFKYFAEIITGKVLDQHFGLNVRVPLPSIKSANRDIDITAGFASNMKYKYTKEDGFVNLGRNQRNPKIDNENINFIMRNEKLDPTTVIQDGPILAGFLKSDPETMYIQLTSFEVYPNAIIDGTFPLLESISEIEGINQSFFDDLKKIDSEVGSEFETLMKDNLISFKTLINTILNSNEYKNYTNALDNFKNTELIDDFENSLIPLANFIKTKKSDFFTKHESVELLYLAHYNSQNITQAQKNAIKTLYEIYNGRIETYKKVSSFFNNIRKEFFGQVYTIPGDFDDLLNSIASNHAIDLYRKLYNPITNGKAKKIILDLRGNGGGYVIDARIFTERFITQQKVWGYQRTKEGNGRFNYSPWTPVETKPHKFALQQNIPIAVLIDENSFSMSEISTMMIKSQGDHVTIVGDNSGGGTAGLGGQDSFNGGNRLSNEYLQFYMPLMAFKNREGKVVEAIGVAPDVKTIPTQEQVDELTTTYIDPAFNAALKAVSK
ncbi:peptidase S41-like protein [Tenacibaculum gallaicum]|uniref:Peptidase S41-like protein n=1 Tax=Tenacibaculum gallaicum TaxID=561505 RepID=A0A3E0I7J0_9FLAO|nr:S41 family peptidase [Tenacibaculum gallaicum]REH54609.1 peptidase S41-like protein [Tenacibaculum gallaicum]